MAEDARVLVRQRASDIRNRLHKDMAITLTTHAGIMFDEARQQEEALLHDLVEDAMAQVEHLLTEVYS